MTGSRGDTQGIEKRTVSFYGLPSPSPNRSNLGFRPHPPRASRGGRHEGRIGSRSLTRAVVSPPGRPSAGDRSALLLAMTDLAAHPALLATDLATTLSATTTCHT